MANTITRTPNWRPIDLRDGGFSPLDWHALPASGPEVNDRVLLYLILKAMKEGALEDLRSLEKAISENNRIRSEKGVPDDHVVSE